MANEQNLISLADRTTEEKREIGIMGGKASGEARRNKKLIKDSIELILGLPIKDKELKQSLKDQGIENEDMTNQLAMVMAMYHKAISGDVNAFNSIRDTIGQKPIERTEVTEIPKIVDDID